MEGNESGLHFLNLAYFFRLIYETVFGIGGTASASSTIIAFLSQLWVLVTILGILACIGAIFLLVHSTTRLYQIRALEAPVYATITRSAEHERLESSRWAYVKQLLEGTNESSWRQAIMEADIILDELLTRLGYIGDSVGEKLRQARFATLNNAWEAHKVRNQIAHEGSSFELTDRLAYRTIANYEAVFREHGEL